MANTAGNKPKRFARWAFCAVAPALGSLTGCSAAPSQNILGSYFPSWILCAFAGIAPTLVIRQVLVATGIDKTLPAPLAVYLALTVAFAFAIWLAWLD